MGAYAGVVSKTLTLIYLITSAITFAIYARDKTAARNSGRRTAEKTLHILAVVGGWPGAMVAQRTFRHKTLKRSFRWVFWLTVGLNLAVVAALFGDHLMQYLH